MCPSMIWLSYLSIHPGQFRYNIFLLCSTRRADQDDVGEGNLCLIGSPDQDTRTRLHGAGAWQTSDAFPFTRMSSEVW